MPRLVVSPSSQTQSRTITQSALVATRTVRARPATAMPALSRPSTAPRQLLEHRGLDAADDVADAAGDGDHGDDNSRSVTGGGSTRTAPSTTAATTRAHLVHANDAAAVEEIEDV